MEAVGNQFREKVYAIVAQIPKGRVMTYGQIAALCGSPRAARIVGGIAHQTQFEHQHLHLYAERSGLDGVQGDNEKRTSRTSSTMSESRKQATQQSAKSALGVGGSASKQESTACPLCNLPWQRVVHKDGSLAAGYPGGVEGHKQVLEAEGVKVSNEYKVDMEQLLWQPVH
jgi:alkylated DNA nucleotide flippase Atl1